MLAKIKTAVIERGKHVAAFEEFNACLPAKHTAEFRAAIKSWEEDSANAPNPFAVTHSGM